MAAKPRTPEPTLLQVVRLGKTYAYELNDKLDWAVLFDNAVLEIKTSSGKTHYWPLDSVTQWITQNLPSNGHA